MPEHEQLGPESLEPRRPGLERSELRDGVARRPLESGGPDGVERYPIYFDGTHPDRARYVHDPLLNHEVQQRFERDGPLEAALSVNGAGDLDDGSRISNCGECARAVAMTLDGRPTGAATLREDIEDTSGRRVPGERIEVMEDWIGREFPALQDSAQSMVDDVATWPEGAHGIVLVEQYSLREQADRFGLDWNDVRRQAARSGEDALSELDQAADERMWHFLNVVKVDGVPTMLDGQVGIVEAADVRSLDAQYASISYQRIDRSEP